jgi:hypothetical protein
VLRVWLLRFCRCLDVMERVRIVVRDPVKG